MTSRVPQGEPPAGWDDLETELCLGILRRVDPTTLLALTRVSRRMNRLASANHVWKGWTLARFGEDHPVNPAPPTMVSKSRRWRFILSGPFVDPRSHLNTQSSWKSTYQADLERATRRQEKSFSSAGKQKHRLDRTSASARTTCGSCGRPQAVCACHFLDAIPPFDNGSCHILVIQHPKCQVSIGTLRILLRQFKHISIICSVDLSPGRHPELDEAVARPGTGLLFPSAISIPADAWGKKTEGLGHRTLIAIDGTWSHAKSLLHYNPRLLSLLTQVHLPEPPPSVFGELKREPSADCVSTAEAMTQAMGHICLDDGDSLMRPVVEAIRNTVQVQKAFARKETE